MTKKFWILIGIIIFILPISINAASSSTNWWKTQNVATSINWWDLPFSFSSSGISGFNSWVYEQKFNDLDDGDLNGQDSWFGSAMVFDIQTSVKYEGTKGVIGQIAGGQIQRDISEISSGIMYVAFRISGIPAGADGPILLLRDGVGWYSKIRFQNTGYIQTHNNTDWINLQTWNINQWYLVALEFDTATDQHRIKIHDGINWSSWYGWYDSNSTGNGITNIYFWRDTDGNYLFYFDTITPNDPTEELPPATQETNTASDFFGIVFFLPFFIYLALALFDGIGACFKDTFFISNRRSR